MDHGHCLVPDVGPPGRRAKIDVTVEQIAQTEMLGQGGGLDQPGVSDQTRIIEEHFESIEGVR